MMRSFKTLDVSYDKRVAGEGSISDKGAACGCSQPGIDWREREETWVS